MSKVTINLDTATGECDVALDGQELENITDFYGSKYDDYFHFRCCQAEKIDDGTWRRVEYMLMGTEEADAAVRSGKSVASKLGDFIKVIGGSKLVHDISQFLHKR